MKKRNLVTPHEDTGLNALRLIALSSVGYYFFKSFKKEGSLKGATGRDVPFNINTDNIIENLGYKIGLNQEQTDQLKFVADQIKNDLLNKKG